MQPLMAGTSRFADPETYSKQMPDEAARLPACAVGATRNGDEVTV